MVGIETLQYLLVVEKDGKGMTGEDIVSVSGLPKSDVYQVLQDGTKSGKIIISRDGSVEIYKANQRMMEDD